MYPRKAGPRKGGPISNLLLQKNARGTLFLDAERDGKSSKHGVFKMDPYHLFERSSDEGRTSEGAETIFGCGRVARVATGTSPL